MRHSTPESRLPWTRDVRSPWTATVVAVALLAHTLAAATPAWAQSCNLPIPAVTTPPRSSQPLPAQIALQLTGATGVQMADFVATPPGPSVPGFVAVSAPSLSPLAPNQPWTTEIVGAPAALIGYRLSKIVQGTVYYVGNLQASVSASLGSAVVATSSAGAAGVFTMEPADVTHVYLREVWSGAYLSANASTGMVGLQPRTSATAWKLPGPYVNPISTYTLPSSTITPNSPASTTITLPALRRVLGAWVTFSGEATVNPSPVGSPPSATVSATLKNGGASVTGALTVNGAGTFSGTALLANLQPLALASGGSATLTLAVNEGPTGVFITKAAVTLSLSYIPSDVAASPPAPPADAMSFNVLSYNLYALPPEVEGWVGQQERLAAIPPKLRALDRATPGGIDVVVVTELWSMDLVPALSPTAVAVLSSSPAVMASALTGVIGALGLGLAAAFSPHLAYIDTFVTGMITTDEGGYGGWKYIAGPIPQEAMRAQDGGVYIFSKHAIVDTHAHVYGAGTCGGAMALKTATGGACSGGNNLFCCAVCQAEDCLAAKGVLYARLRKTDASGTCKFFNVAATHLQSGGTDTPGIASVRTQQLGQLRDAIAGWKVPSGEPFIVAGDMNIDALWTKTTAPNECPGMLTTLNATVPALLPIAYDTTGRALYYTSGDNADLRCPTQDDSGAISCRATGATCNVWTDGNGVKWCSNPPRPYEWLDYIVTLNDFQKPLAGAVLQPLPFGGDVNGNAVTAPWNYRDIGYNIRNGWSVIQGNRYHDVATPKGLRKVWNLSDHHPVLGTFQFPITAGSACPSATVSSCSGWSCSTVNQVCASGPGYTCLNEVRSDGNCKNPPCWFQNVPPPVASCPNWSCGYTGQLCTQDDGYICLNQARTDGKCASPPCWFEFDEEVPVPVSSSVQPKDPAGSSQASNCSDACPLTSQGGACCTDQLTCSQSNEQHTSTTQWRCGLAPGHSPYASGTYKGCNTAPCWFCTNC